LFTEPTSELPSTIDEAPAFEMQLFIAGDYMPHLSFHLLEYSVDEKTAN
jgi:hypothetical protein